MNKNVVVGGTFNPIHIGHRNLLEKALKTGDTVIGLTSDELARKSREREVDDWEKRRDNLEKVAEEISSEHDSSFEIVKLKDPVGPAIESEELEYIVISPEDKTVRRVNSINHERVNKHGFNPLKIRMVDPIYDSTGERISSTRVANGEIDTEGNIIKDKKEVSFVGDIHYGFKGIRKEKIRNDLENRLETVETDTIIIVGDLIHEVDEKTDKKNFEEIYNIFDKNFENVYFTPGNHDVSHLSKEFMENIVGHSIPLKTKIGESNVILVDSATETPQDNIGKISDSSFSMLSETEGGSTIISHFPLVYTTYYQQSDFFKHYPEGVFPINKYLLQNIDMSNIEKQVFAHLHLDQNVQYNRKETMNTILKPYNNITSIEDGKEKAIITENPIHTIKL